MNPINQGLIDDFLARERRGNFSRNHYAMVRRILEDFAAYLAKPVTHAADTDIKAYGALKRPRYSANSYNRICGILAKFYRFLLEVEEVLVDPTRRLGRVKNESTRHLGVFSEVEVKRLFRVIPPSDAGLRDRALFELLYATGLRIGECLALDVVDVDTGTREVVVATGKNGTARTVPMGEEACRSLDVYLSIRHRFLITGGDREALFLNGAGRRLRYNTVRGTFSRYKDAAKVTAPGSLHALRHSCATHLIRRGAPLDMVGRLLGHETAVTTARYAHLTVEDIRTFVEKEGRHEGHR